MQAAVAAGLALQGKAPKRLSSVARPQLNAPPPTAAAMAMEAQAASMAAASTLASSVAHVQQLQAHAQSSPQPQTPTSTPLQRLESLQRQHLQQSQHDFLYQKQLEELTRQNEASQSAASSPSASPGHAETPVDPVAALELAITQRAAAQRSQELQQQLLLQAYRIKTASQPPPPPLQQSQPSLMNAHMLAMQRNILAVQEKYRRQSFPPAAPVLSPAELEAQQTKARARRSFLKEVKAQFIDLMQTRKAHRKALGRCMRDVAKLGQAMERKRAVELARQARAEQREREQRLVALKNNDIEAYKTLLKDVKNVRLQTLLGETARWEAKLKAMIAGKRRTGRREERIKMEEEHKQQAVESATAAVAFAAAAAAPALSAAAPSGSAAPDTADAMLVDTLAITTASGSIPSQPVELESKSASQETKDGSADGSVTRLHLCCCDVNAALFLIFMFAVLICLCGAATTRLIWSRSLSSSLCF